VIFLLNSNTKDDFIKSCIDINEAINTDVSILFYEKTGNNAKDEEFEAKINKMLYESPAEKILEIVCDLLDVKKDKFESGITAPGEEKTGMPRVIEALECNMWSNMIRMGPKMKQLPSKMVENEAPKPEISEKKQSEETKKPSENKEKYDPEKNYEDEIDKELEDYEALMNDMMNIRDK